MEVVNAGSITKAAEKLRISKSGISQQITALEKSLNVQLFFRVKRTNTLTFAGKKLYAQSTQLQHLIHSIIRSSSDDDDGQINIATSYPLYSTIVIPALSRLRQQYPRLQPNLIIEDEPGSQYSTIDVSITMGELPDSGLRARTIGSYRETFVASPEFAEGNNISSSSEFYASAFIANAWQSGKNYLEVMNEGGELTLLEIENTMNVNLSCSTVELIKLHQGFSLLPDFFTKDLIDSGELIQIYKNFSSPSRPINFLHAYDRDQVPSIVKDFSRCLSDVLHP